VPHPLRTVSVDADDDACCRLDEIKKPDERPCRDDRSLTRAVSARAADTNARADRMLTFLHGAAADRINEEVRSAVNLTSTLDETQQRTALGLAHGWCVGVVPE
jgi:hypothetical protein